MKTTALLALAIPTLAIGVLAFARDPNTRFALPDFSATQTMGNLPAGKVYVSDSNIRFERVPGLQTIYLSDTNKEYQLYHRGYCLVMPAEKSTLMPNPLQLLFGAKVERTEVGSETVDGHPCKVEKIVATAADGSVTRSKVWEAEDLKGVPLKIETVTEHGTIMAIFRDVVLEKPDPELFKTPANCIPPDKMYTKAK